VFLWLCCGFVVEKVLTVLTQNFYRQELMRKTQARTNRVANASSEQVVQMDCACAEILSNPEQETKTYIESNQK
jgi:hypothetical protein